VFHWDTLAERREKLLTFDRPQKIRIPKVHRWPFAVDEYAFNALMTGYEWKKLTRNPQVDLDGKWHGCRDRGGWHWEFGQASFHVYPTLLSFHMEYHAQEAPGSSWELQIPQKDQETLFDFLVRIVDTLELYLLDNTQTWKFLYQDSRTIEDEYDCIFFHGPSWEDCVGQFRKWVTADLEDYRGICNKAERYCKGEGGLEYQWLFPELGGTVLPPEVWERKREE
jgi:hypothetical protein